jgi:hypothetical protein
VPSLPAIRNRRESSTEAAQVPKISFVSLSAAKDLLRNLLLPLLVLLAFPQEICGFSAKGS